MGKIMSTSNEDEAVKILDKYMDIDQTTCQKAEEKMKSLRLKIEQEVLGWSDVTTKKMYGCPCYKYKEKIIWTILHSISYRIGLYLD
jgi:hypothetical protein